LVLASILDTFLLRANLSETFQQIFAVADPGRFEPLPQQSLRSLRVMVLTRG
jgi:hypothetical protein